MRRSIGTMETDDNYSQLKRRLGARIRTLRKARGLTQEQLSELVGIGPQTQRRIENGRTNARLETLFHLAEHLDVAVRDLFEDADTPVPEATRPPGEAAWMSTYRATPEHLRPLLQEVVRPFARRDATTNMVATPEK